MYKSMDDQLLQEQQYAQDEAMRDWMFEQERQRLEEEYA